jgi:hypothetical protein
MRLTRSAAVPYSEAEAAIFKCLSKKKRTTDELVGLRYPKNGTDKPPFDPSGSVRGALRNLAKKIEANGEPFRLKKEGRRGPNAISYWLEDR